jgi:DNA-directed RNA polymerase specialized sigma24 family protein/ribosome-associated translation inhibitor RaiA
MIIKPRFEGLATHDTTTWQASLEEFASRQLRPLLVAHGADAGVLHATLRRPPRLQHGFEVQLHMHLPGKKILAASARGEQVPAISERAVKRLFREAQRHFAQLHGQNRDRRELRRERLRVLEQRLGALPAPVAEQAQQSVEALLQRLTPVAARELAYLRASGDLPEGYPSVNDVIDEAAAHTRAAWGEAPDAGKVYQQLLKNLFKTIDREVAAVRPYAQAESIDATVAPDADDQAEAMVEEDMYEYFQPDDTLSLADVLPAPEPQSDEAAEAESDEEQPQPEPRQRSEQAYALDLAKTLPITWRRSLLLSVFDTLSAADIADVLDAEETAVVGWIEQACSFVQARLADAGVALPTGSAREVVFAVLQAGR